MSSSTTPDRANGPSAPLSSDSLYHFCFSNPFQHSPNDFVPKALGKPNPNHTFDGQTIPLQRPSLVHAGTGASLSWQRAKADSLRIARYLRAIVGDELPWDGQGGNEPIHSPRTTVLLHLPNCLAFPLLLFGASASLCTVSPISTMLTPNELANILAKARPQVLVTTVGPDGEDKLRSGLETLLQRPDKDVGQVSGKKVKEWAKELASCWDAGRRAKKLKGSKVPLRQQRVWTVNLASAGGADYYGSSSRGDGVSTLADPRDWSHLLSPPPGHKHAGSPDSMSREALVTRRLTKEEQARRVALLLWSSGTTGESKGVLISHRNLVASVTGNWKSCPSMVGTSRGAGETWVALAPWCHIYGLATLLLPTFAVGATLILPASPKFELPTYLGLITKYKATTMHIAPPVAVSLRSSPLLDPSSPEAKDIDLSSVRTLLSGGAPTPTEVIKGIYQRTGKMLQIGYGATETGSNAHCVALDLSPSNPDSMDELGSVGLPQANLEICIRPSSDTTAAQTSDRYKELLEQIKLKQKAGESAPVEPSLPGEVCIRGPHVMLGYYSGQASNEGSGARDEELTSGAITSDGYYRTGDEGLLDYAGRLWIVGRTKELIKVRGFQVPPAELDGLFAKHPDVIDAAATGVNEGDEGEQVVMYIVPKKESVLGHAKEQADLVHQLSDFISDKAAFYKWPRYYVFVPALLKNPTGKILRKNLHTLKGTRHRAPRRDRQSKM